MAITAKEFGKTADGQTVTTYTLDNGRGLVCEILDLGGIVRSLFVNGRDVVLGRDSVEEYLDNNGYFGALIGRHANRIKCGRFELGTKTYNVGVNEGVNSLHGGLVGFDRKIWAAEAKDSEEPELILTLNSPDGEEGFPGNLKVKATYKLTSDNGLSIHYEGECDSDTLLNMTNHSYFNLDGHDSGNIHEHTLWIGADFYTPNCAEGMPTGEVLAVKGTPFDFTTPKKVGRDIFADCEQLKMFGGYDHNYPLAGRGMRKVAVLEGTKGISMEMYTDQPATQLYTGNGLECERVCKNSVVYKTHQALCLESQCFPNAMSYSHYPSPILLKGEKYDTTTVYKFIF